MTATLECQRCNLPKPLTHQIKSDVVDLLVCRQCAQVAMNLMENNTATEGGLIIIPIGGQT